MGKPQQQQQRWSNEGQTRSSSSSDDDEEEEQCDDDFFESLDRVPSGVSFDLDVPSSSTDGEYDDGRFSFASAIAPPGRSPPSSDDDDTPAYDFGIWMAEPMSIDERRRRLLQGFTSIKENPTPTPPPPQPNCTTRHSLKISRSRLSRRTSDPPPAESAPPPVLQSKTLTLARSRSDVAIRSQAGPALFRRASSAPPSIGGRPGHQIRAGDDLTGEGGVGGARGTTELDSPSGDGVCRIKNLDTGKEFVVSELRKDGTWGRLNDLQTGLQLTLEEFEKFLGYSPIVKELMRRVNLGGGSGGGGEKKRDGAIGGVKSSKLSSGRRKGGWLKNIKFVASSMTGHKSEKDRECGLGSSMRMSSSSGGNERMKVRQHGKSHKELTGLYMCQQIQAHQGSIWCIKFSADSLYLASAGEDRVVHVWQVMESDTVSSSLLRQNSRSSLPPLPQANGSSSQSAPLGTSKRTRKVKLSSASRRSSVPEYIVMPETIFSLSEKPFCSFEGHQDDVLDLSWSKSQVQHLLSSSMDKTVRLWDIESKTCLKLFAHNDFVTCIQFNPVDDRYFISGSLDAKIRIWSIPDRQVVDWTDLHEMVTAVCYTPDAQGALVGSHKGSCRMYNTSDCKLSQESQIDIWSKKRKSHAKKITGFQFAPINPAEVLITSADSRIRVFDGPDMIHKFRGFRNTSSQISASFTLDGKFVVCASEDSHVYIWKRNLPRNGKSKGLINTRSHEHFYCKDVSVAIPWPAAGSNCPLPSLPSSSGRLDHQCLDSPDSQSTISSEDKFHSSRSQCPPLPKSSPEHVSSPSAISPSPSQRSEVISPASVSASSSSSSSSRWYGGGSTRSGAPEGSNAWGLVVVTAGLGGEIKVYQNFGLPLRLKGQSNLF